jgi:hypothetical protein
MCFNTWSIFSKLIGKHDLSDPDLTHYKHTIAHPKSTLDIYITTLASPSFDFITSLTITYNFAIPDLLKLSSITNLGVLKIVHCSPTPAQGVSDYVMRAWHLAALNDGAFRVLRILKLWGHVRMYHLQIDSH